MDVEVVLLLLVVLFSFVSISFEGIG